MPLRNKYINIAHQLENNRTFSLEYDSSLFRAVEIKEKNIGERNFSIAEYIDQPNSIFTFRSEDYYSIKYIREANKNIDAETITNLNPALTEAIKNNKLFMQTDEKCKYNIIIKHFNDLKIDKEDIEAIENLQYSNNIELFYLIPLYIYILKYTIKTILANI